MTEKEMFEMIFGETTSRQSSQAELRLSCLELAKEYSTNIRELIENAKLIENQITS